MSLTTTFALPRRVTSASFSPALGVDAQLSFTAATEATTPGDGLGKAAPAVASAVGLADAVGELDEVECDDPLELEPHATRTVSATMAAAGWRLLKRPRILTGGGLDRQWQGGVGAGAGGRGGTGCVGA